MSKIKELFVKELIGKSIKPSQTKNRGQELELICLNLLGYNITKDNFLEGGFPDIKNQLIEVKIQDSPTVDLCRYSPASEEIIFSDLNITTLDIRYIIALTNPQNGIIEGLVITPGKYLGNYFTYVSDESYKCQRSITINKFDKYLNQSVFNPEIGDGQIQML